MNQAFKPPSKNALIAQRQPIQSANLRHEQQLTRLEKIALMITDRIGTMGFFMAIVTWTTLWLGWNFLAPQALKFDPPMAFVFWLFLSNMIQIFLMPLLMIGQNLQGRHAEARAEADFAVNTKAEREIEAVLDHLEYQNALLIALIEHQGLTLEQVLAQKSEPSKI